MNRIQMMELSLRCFGFGVCSLVPVLGLGPAVISIRYYMRVRLHAAKYWNPAGAYLHAGLFCSGFGLFGSLVVFGGILYALALAA